MVDLTILGKISPENLLNLEDIGINVGTRDE